MKGGKKNIVGKEEEERESGYAFSEANVFVVKVTCNRNDVRDVDHEREAFVFELLSLNAFNERPYDNYSCYEIQKYAYFSVWHKLACIYVISMRRALLFHQVVLSFLFFFLSS